MPGRQVVSGRLKRRQSPCGAAVLNSWISRDFEKIGATTGSVLAETGLEAGDTGGVLLTGRIDTGEQLLQIARGFGT